MTRYRRKAGPPVRAAHPSRLAVKPAPPPPERPAPKIENPYGRYYSRPRSLEDLKPR